MTKRELLERPNSCLNRALDDEPVFLLRANDELAPSLVRMWAYRYAASRDEMTPREQAKASEAIQVAGAMQLWWQEHGNRKYMTVGDLRKLLAENRYEDHVPVWAILELREGNCETA